MDKPHGDPTIKKVHLADARRANDLLSETGRTLPTILAQAGVDVDGARHVATQRALRMVLEMRGEPIPTTVAGVRLTPREEDMLAVMATMWIDGMLAGVKAKRRDVSELIARKSKEWGHIEAVEPILRALAEEIEP